MDLKLGTNNATTPSFQIPTWIEQSRAKSESEVASRIM